MLVSSSFVREPGSTAPAKHGGGHPSKTVNVYLHDDGDSDVLLTSFINISTAAAFLTPNNDRNFVKRYADSGQVLESDALGGLPVIIRIDGRVVTPGPLVHSGVAVFPALVHSFDVIPGQIGVITLDMTSITYYAG